MAKTLGAMKAQTSTDMNPVTEANAAAAMGVNLQTFRDAVSKMIASNNEVSAVRTKRNAMRKQMKADGFDLKILDDTIRMAEWDRSEVRQIFATRRLYGEFMKLPVQGDLFNADNASTDEIQEREWRALGYTAATLGRPRKAPDTCPPEYVQHYLRGMDDHDEEQWSAEEKAEAQLEAAAEIPADKPNNVTDIAKALEAKPRGRKAKTDTDASQGATEDAV